MCSGRPGNQFSLKVQVLQAEALPDHAPAGADAEAPAGATKLPHAGHRGLGADRKGEAGFRNPRSRDYIASAEATTKVTLKVAIDNTGRVTNVTWSKIIQRTSAGSALAKAMRKVKFIPFQLAGTPVSVN